LRSSVFEGVSIAFGLINPLVLSHRPLSERETVCSFFAATIHRSQVASKGAALRSFSAFLAAIGLLILHPGICSP
jgi:hypothetical protein